MTARQALVVVVINVLVSAALLAAYAIWIGPSRAPRLAVLDVAELYRLKEREIAAVLVKRDASEADRLNALQGASQFGTQITTLIEQLPAECDCLILARGAIAGSGTALPDLTPAVRQRLGL
jgi:hypothetical protein